MSVPSQPQNFFVQSGNMQVFVSADNSAGATSYVIQRSLDNVTFTTIATVAVPQYLDTTVNTNTEYWYQMAAANTNGTGSTMAYNYIYNIHTAGYGGTALFADNSTSG